MAIHDNLQSAVNAAQAATEAIRKAADDLEREAANAPVPLGGVPNALSSGSNPGR